MSGLLNALDVVHLASRSSMMKWWLALSNAYMPASQSDDWATPGELWKKLDAIHNFDVDAAASQANHLCLDWYGLDHYNPKRRDGLSASWNGRTVWINPPYGRIIAEWAKAAQRHADGGGRSLCYYRLEQIQGGSMSIAYLMTWSLSKAVSSSVGARWQLHSHR